ncbi:MAG: nucleoside triphosphate pyrophosphohydrolase [Flavobacteriaceae bacterium]
MHSKAKKLEAFSRLLDIMDKLRSDCPWDKKQTFETLRHLTIEETYELGDAILDNDLVEIKKELGDLLLHIVFYSKIGSETNTFDIADVCNTISDKLIYRHPHIYGDTKATTEEEVKRNWEQLKLKEGKGKKSILEGVPKSLPAMVKASRMQEKVAAVGFEWENNKQFLDKLTEEITEFNIEKEKQDIDKMEAEFGDVLFALINYARFQKINPENALERTNKKFIKRFQLVEKQAKENGLEIADVSLKTLLSYWEKAKA